MHAASIPWRCRARWTCRSRSFVCWPAGLDIAYPPENGQLFAQIASRGCLLSEYPPGTSPMRGNFPVRNRILSGLSVGVLVVEASAQSGALITARLALEQGRDVFAIPGNLGVASCEGTNRLLREGALMPENGWELLQEYTHLFPGKLADGRRREVMEQRFGSHYAAAVPAQPLPERPAKPARPAAPSPEKSPALDKKTLTIRLQGLIVTERKHRPPYPATKRRSMPP
ncbi:MAG: DNA-processing protein DprA [Oscillospiraceae bacterium]